MILAPLALLLATLAHAETPLTFTEWDAANHGDDCGHEFLDGNAESATNRTVLSAALRGRGHSVQEDGLFSIYLHQACYLHRVFTGQKTATPGSRYLPTPKEIEASKPGMFGEAGVDVLVGDKTLTLKTSRKPEVVSIGSAKVLVFSRPPAVAKTGRTCEAAKAAGKAAGDYDKCYEQCTDGCDGEDFFRALTSVCNKKRSGDIDGVSE